MSENPTLAEPVGPGPEPGTDGPAAESTQSTSTPPPPAGGYYAPAGPPRPPLRRSRTDRVIAGVCGGFARQYGIDPVLLRILVVVLTVFTGGAFVLAYVIAWLLMPDEPAWAPTPGAPVATASGAAVSSAVPPSYAAGGTGTYVDPATGAVYGAPQYYAPAKAPEPRSFLGLITLSAAVVVGGLLSILAVAGVDVPVAVIAAAMLGVVALGLLVGAFRGRARWLIAPAVVLLLVAQAAVVIPRAVSGSWGAGVGERRWTPTVSNPAAYELGAGDARLDLTNLPAGPAVVSARVGLGSLVVTIRPDTTLVMHGRVGAGDVRLPGTPATNGTNLSVDTTVPASTTATTTVDLTVDMGLGELEVRRATS
ncbi:MAG TPA: PspC domain-containing protein [Candidatus Angelobacter sp.]|nr:PspC domain-containing protein [Candidatus Angelobacter sp.]